MKKYDILVKNARVVDGTGAPWYFADVAIAGERIAEIGTIAPASAAQVVEAEGRFLTPGFVDAHVHSDLALLADPDFPAGIFQGVTSHVIGQDGISYAPSSPAWQKHLRQYFAGVNGDPALNCSWESVAEYLRCFEEQVALNVAYLLPQGTIRLEVMGFETRPPTRDEMARMQAIATQGMREGAIGISTGLDYIPCHYSGTEELCQLCKPVGELGGIYVSHIRSYGAALAEAVAETADIGQAAGMPVHISHYNGPAPLLARLIDEARAGGSDMTFDTYPFLAGCTILSMVALPRWMEEGGTEETLRRLGDSRVREKLTSWFANPAYPLASLQLAYVDCEEDRELEGLRLPDAAAKRSQPLPEFICDLLVRSRLKVACVAHHSNRTEEDMLALMRHPAHVGGSDGIYTGSRPHPRGFSTFARFLEYVRDRGVMPLEEMVRHLAWHPARRFHLKHRGQIGEGFFADLALFDLSRIKAHGAYGEEPRFAEGMDWVFVNGRPVLANGRPTGIRPGRAVRGPAF